PFPGERLRHIGAVGCLKMHLWPSAPNLPPRPQADMRCPTCGAYGASVTAMWRDRNTGMVFQAHKSPDVASMVGPLLVSGLVAALVLNALLGSDFIWLAFVIALVVVLAYVASYTWREVRREANAVRVNLYKCQRCLHEWQWAEGRP